VYGPALDGETVVPVPARFAALFARAHALVLGRPAAAHVGDGELQRFEVARARRTTPDPELVARPPDDTVRDLLECAGAVGAPIAVECRHDDGDRLDADSYTDRLATITEVAAPTVVSLAVAPDQLAAFVGIAGPIIAWPELTMRRA